MIQFVASGVPAPFTGSSFTCFFLLTVFLCNYYLLLWTTALCCNCVMSLHAPAIKDNYIKVYEQKRVSVPLGRAGFTTGTCCMDTPEDDVVILVEEEDDEDEEEPCPERGSVSVVWRLNVSPRSVPMRVSVNTCRPPPP